MKVKIFYSSVKAVLLYASEAWTVTQRTVDRIQVFFRKCLRRLLNIQWPDRKYNKQGTVEVNERTARLRTTSKKWKWIRHTVRRISVSIAR